MADSIPLSGKEFEILRNLMLAYVATTELRINALETILKRKDIIASREELDNELESQMQRNFGDMVKGLASLMNKYHLRMLDIGDNLSFG